MRFRSQWLLTLAALALAVALVGCSKSNAPAAAPASNSAPAAAQNTSAAQSAAPAASYGGGGSRAAARSYRRAARRASAPAAPSAPPAPPPPPPKVTIAAGTHLAIRLNQALGSDISSVDQPFVGEINRPVVVGGQVVVPRGARVNGKVTVAASSGHFKGRSELALALVSLQYNGHTYPLSGVWEVLGPSRGSRSVKMIGGGAGIGALVGALVGHGKGAAIGAAIGAGAGTAGEALTKPTQVDLKSEAVITVTLRRHVRVHPASALLP